MKKEKPGGVVEEEGECGDDVVGLLKRNRRKLNILCVKKIAKMSAREIPEGKGEGDLRCKSLFAVCQRLLGCQRMTRQGREDFSVENDIICMLCSITRESLLLCA